MRNVACYRSWWSERIIWRNWGEGTGVHYDMDVYKQGECEKTNNGIKRNENEQSQIYANQTKRSKKLTVRNESKNQCQKMKHTKGTSQHNMACKTRLSTQKQTNCAARNTKKTRKCRREKPAKNKKCKNK